jgi:hypothetical protein
MATKGNTGGMGMRKHARSGYAPKSPKFKHAMKREAEQNSVKATSRIKDPKQSVSDLFHRK